MDYSKLVESLKKQDANRKCFDCGVVGTTYASLNFGTFVCSQCAGILRGLNFKVKPLGISIFTLNEYEILQKNGNEKAKYIWMGLFDPYKHEKPDPKNYNDVKKHLIKKYKEKQFFRESKGIHFINKSIEDDIKDPLEFINKCKIKNIEVGPLWTKKNIDQKNDGENNIKGEKSKDNKNQKFQLISTSYKITENRKNEINIKSPKNKELKEINPPKKRPHSIKYNHIKIKTNLKKLGNIFDINEVNVNKKIGEQVDKYIIGKILGKGAYATVNLATDKASKINYAMKIYKKRDIKDKVRKKCVDNEIEILKKIDHKNIIKLIEVIDLKDYILIIQELFMGISLGEYHKKYWKTEDLTKKKEEKKE